MDRAEQLPPQEQGQRNALVSLNRIVVHSSLISLIKRPYRAQNFQFSPEELQVLQECNREAFFQRSLPLGTAFGLGTYYAIQRGFLKVTLQWS